MLSGNKSRVYGVAIYMALPFLLPQKMLYAQRGDAIFYSSLNAAVRLGQFDGVATLRELKQHGDFGVGSQDGLAGELVLLNGIAYHIPVDGNATLMPEDATLPFAAAKFFKTEKKMLLNGPRTMQQLEAYLDSVINTNRFSAIKVSGSFQSISYKVYYPQRKPYPTIAQTPAKFFDSTGVSGTMVGFFTPRSAMVLNSPNYHFHFINSAGTSGGHVDQCVLQKVVIEVDYADGLQVQLPPEPMLNNIDLNKQAE